MKPVCQCSELAHIVKKGQLCSKWQTGKHRTTLVSGFTTTTVSEKERKYQHDQQLHKNQSPRSIISRNSFASRATRLWNTLPRDVNLAEDLPSFKALLGEWLKRMPDLDIPDKTKTQFWTGHYSYPGTGRLWPLWGADTGAVSVRSYRWVAPLCLSWILILTEISEL